jgi:hypothetical protein
VDFTGWFETKDGLRCYPLTISDAYSRHLICCEGVRDPNGNRVASAFDSAFRQFGLPRAIRSDSGPPFASVGPAGLTNLSVCWLRLGIRVERIAPGKPQQNGRHERMHRTLGFEVDVQGALPRQLRAFDLWRAEFNEERPHAALGQKPPASVYTPSSLVYPRRLLSPYPGAWSQTARVDKEGFISFDRRKLLIAKALRHQDDELVRGQMGQHPAGPARGLSPPRHHVRPPKAGLDADAVPRPIGLRP